MKRLHSKPLLGNEAVGSWQLAIDGTRNLTSIGTPLYEVERAALSAAKGGPGVSS